MADWASSERGRWTSGAYSSRLPLPPPRLASGGWRRQPAAPRLAHCMPRRGARVRSGSMRELDAFTVFHYPQRTAWRVRCRVMCEPIPVHNSVRAELTPRHPTRARHGAQSALPVAIPVMPRVFTHHILLIQPLLNANTSTPRDIHSIHIEPRAPAARASAAPHHVVAAQTPGAYKQTTTKRDASAQHKTAKPARDSPMTDTTPTAAAAAAVAAAAVHAAPGGSLRPSPGQRHASCYQCEGPWLMSAEDIPWTAHQQQRHRDPLQLNNQYRRTHARPDRTSTNSPSAPRTHRRRLESDAAGRQTKARAIAKTTPGRTTAAGYRPSLSLLDPYIALCRALPTSASVRLVRRRTLAHQ
ncbi:hypothetical protein POSPLADRAFT_1053369 [Postia placenta MAD-698-R-SB12]|uniref:Uncharacterized protein n=1 Tax=Postia placenta MAD-698-R-SB12 TaxID=670580 RepID=A0A1X6NEF2_9APHY|nr:hypothetical protein POSPLADRAFT_1053369 [Postia placenta MAD-698-R-SB12]OSX66753.1 hypothetical protein POSPLADRAFT_1053369 [Postia placenta MAD-698-R-SB12]